MKHTSLVVWLEWVNSHSASESYLNSVIVKDWPQIARGVHLMRQELLQEISFKSNELYLAAATRQFWFSGCIKGFKAYLVVWPMSKG